MDKDLNSLWVQYKEGRQLVARDELIVHYAPLVKYVANRLAINLSTVVEVDELYSYGIEGLIDAIEKFDHKRNIKFETYANLRIRGSMIDGLRAMDWIPVSVRQKSKELERAYSRLEAQLGRPASDQEICAELKIGLDELANLLRETSTTSILSLDDFLDGDDTGDKKKRIIDMLEDDKSVSAQELVELSEVKDLLASSIGKLPDKERTVVHLYYYEGLTLKEIGLVLKLSESRISQLHTKAILRLRGGLGKRKSILM